MSAESDKLQPLAQTAEGHAPAAPLAGTQSGGSSHKLLWFFVVILLLAGAGYAMRDRLTPFVKGLLPHAGRAGAPPARRPISVVTATARRGDLPIYLDAPGTVIPLNSVTIRTRVDGQITKINFTEGQTVREGDLLVQIDPRPFQVQLSQAQGQLAKDEALLKNAQLDLERYQSAGNAVARQQLDTARSSVSQLEGTVKSDQAQIDSANLQLTYSRITSPISGQIGLKLVDQGNIVHASDPVGIALITQVEPITVTFSLWEDLLPRVMKARAGGDKLPVEIFNRDRTIRLATGLLLAVDSQIDPQTLSAKFKATFENKDRALYPNQAVNVRLLVDTKVGAVLIPTAGLQHSPQSDFVYVVTPESTVDLRTVTAGPIEKDAQSIEQGLAAGEVVVIEGVDKLEPKMQVIVSDAEAPPSGAREGGAAINATDAAVTSATMDKKGSDARRGAK